MSLEEINVVTYGGGTNSSAMIIGMYLHDIPIHRILFADPGGERRHTLDFIERFNVWLEKHDLPKVEPVYYFDKGGERLTLEQECLKNGSLPPIAYGFKTCSQKYKIRTIDRVLKEDERCRAIWASGGKVNKYVGYDAGETLRVQHAFQANDQDPKFKNHYPLYTWGWDRAECVRVIEREGLPKPGKSSCFFCPSMKKAEIIDLFENEPDMFGRAVAIERNAAENLKTVKGLGRKWSWEDLIAEYQRQKEAEAAQISLFDFMESPGGCLCGAPCGCYDG